MMLPVKSTYMVVHAILNTVHTNIMQYSENTAILMVFLPAMVLEYTVLSTRMDMPV